VSDPFYRDYDRDYLCNSANDSRKPDYRGIFHQDRDRIMFTPAFRRLQAKTQVFQAGEYDFYRTRLTHSMEVASIAKSIAVWLRTQDPAVAVDPDLLEAICLAHDIGHPPFGHSGERVLNALMEPYGGFEGNAQTLRILTRTIYNRGAGRGGMSPSRALLDGVLKYKRLHRDRQGEQNHFIYDDQADVLEFCFGTRDLAAALDDPNVNNFHSLECQIMDLADDLAYSCFDLVDGAKARFLTPDRLQRWAAARPQPLNEIERRCLDQLLDMMAKDRLQAKMNGVIGDLIGRASLQPAENFMTEKTRRHAYTLCLQPEARARIKLHKALSRELIFGSSAQQQIEFKGGHVLRELGRSLFANYAIPLPESSGKTAPPNSPLHLVPDEVHRAVCLAPTPAERARLLCDHLSGMTDAYALRSFKRLFDPDYGSISELI
jgi:dGTPase